MCDVYHGNVKGTALYNHTKPRCSRFHVQRRVAQVPAYSRMQTSLVGQHWSCLRRVSKQSLWVLTGNCSAWKPFYFVDTGSPSTTTASTLFPFAWRASSTRACTCEPLIEYRMYTSPAANSVCDARCTCFKSSGFAQIRRQFPWTCQDAFPMDSTTCVWT